MQNETKNTSQSEIEENKCSKELQNLDKKITNDGFEVGDYCSRYFGKCTIQLCFEGGWLAVLLTIPFVLFIYSGCDIHNLTTLWPPLGNHIALAWFSGLLGGAVFATKWFYRSVAHGIWSRDRVFWRFLSPLMSAALGVFAYLLLKGNILSLINPALFNDATNICVVGFLTGMCSDSVMAALSSLSSKLFPNPKNKDSDAHQQNQ
jgi:hypothetical protein